MGRKRPARSNGKRHPSIRLPTATWLPDFHRFYGACLQLQAKHRKSGEFRQVESSKWFAVWCNV
jgi:hypothetical protein